MTPVIQDKDISYLCFIIDTNLLCNTIKEIILCKFVHTYITQEQHQ